ANTIRLNYLTLPVNLAYTQRSDGQGLQAFAGPYASCLVGGHYQNDFNFYTLGATGTFTGQVAAGDHNPGTAGSNATYSKRWDVGVQAGLGYRYQQVLLQVGYSLGLRNLAATIPGYPAGTLVTATPIYNRGFQACLAYLFGHHA
ncbi:MAG: PorT family protein, partial [Hymenobacter sp.]